MTSVPLFYRNTIIATADATFKLVSRDKWFESVDIFIYDNSAYMGDRRDQDVLIQASDLYYSLHPVNINDFFFKNVTAGENTRIVVVGFLLTDIRKQQLGIPVV